MKNMLKNILKYLQSLMALSAGVVSSGVWPIFYKHYIPPGYCSVQIQISSACFCVMALKIRTFHLPKSIVKLFII